MRAMAALALMLGVVTAGDSCAAFTDCKTCAGVNNCGWCSTPVTYADGTTGPQCASPSEGKEFTCSGLYSTSQCIEGWVCDEAGGTCRQALPGQGVQREKCEASCTAGPVQKVYGCKNGTKTCVEVAAGTAGSGSRDECLTSCWVPSAPVYKCNPSTQKCEKVPTGTAGSSSQEVCEARGCDSGDWKCDADKLQCVEGGGHESKAMCDGNCKEQNDPCQDHYTCADCLAAGPMCGWCSENVTYANGRTGSQCAGVKEDILPFQCLGHYSNTACATPSAPPTPAPTNGSSPLPPKVNCPEGSTVLLQYSCPDQTCGNCAFTHGEAVECVEPHCTYYCSGKCQPTPAFGTSFMWTCNDLTGGDSWTNATLVHYLQQQDCTGAIQTPGAYGAGTFPLDTCGSEGPNVPPKYNTFRCVPCGDACKGN